MNIRALSVGNGSSSVSNPEPSEKSGLTRPFHSRMPRLQFGRTAAGGAVAGGVWVTGGGARLRRACGVGCVQSGRTAAKVRAFPAGLPGARQTITPEASIVPLRRLAILFALSAGL